MTQMANVIKQAWHGQDIANGSIVYLLVMTILGSMIAVKVFRWE